jgi:hypothetical protein
MLLPGCVCCGCQYPFKASTVSVEVTVESTGMDVYWGGGVQSDGAVCPCNVASGTYTTTQGAGSYKPPSGVFSLSQFLPGSNIFVYEDTLVQIRINLFASGTERFLLQGATIPRRGAAAQWPTIDCQLGVPDMRPISGPGSLILGTYGFNVSQSCSGLAYTCNAPWSPGVAGHSTPTVTQCPTASNPFVEFGFSTYVPAKNVAAMEAAHTANTGGCAAPVTTIGYEGGTAGTAQPATFKITSIKVFYNDGTPDLELLPI